MKTYAMTGASALADFQGLATRAAAAGFDGLVVTESGRTAYLACAAAALSGADLDLATGVAVAFPRSPMVTAEIAWELAEASGGRFRLGLGTQVRAHIERRYSSPFDPPGPRLQEYVEAVRACFRAFRGEESLAFDGDHYAMSLLPAMWSPGPIPVPDPPIDVAAVNPWMLRMAGRVADGVHVHPLNTPTYLETTVLVETAAGAERAGREPSDVDLFVPVFCAPGDTDEERSTWRETARAQIGFYGSTPNYAFVFAQIGHPDATAHLREKQKAGDIAGMAAVIDDDILAHFVVEGTWDELPARIEERMAPLTGAGRAVHVVLYQAGFAVGSDDFERFGEVGKQLT